MSTGILTLCVFFVFSLIFLLGAVFGYTVSLWKQGRKRDSRKRSSLQEPIGASLIRYQRWKGDCIQRALNNEPFQD
jgi:hypothetical protein